MSELGALSPTELAARLAARPESEALVLLDVREPEELAICKLDGVTHIPLGELPARLDELAPDAEVVCICHHGIRSARAASWLITQGFERVWNLTGGVDGWSRDVDPSFPVY